jgi:hypothetical protein
MDYLENAPAVLVELYGHPNPFRQKAILGRLLTEPEMKSTWKRIEESVPAAWDYLGLWREIVYSLHKSRKPVVSRPKKRTYFVHIAQNAEQLSNSLADGPLDLLTYEFFPHDMAQVAFNVTNWLDLSADKKNQIARLAVQTALWPSLTDLLAELIKRANILAVEAGAERRRAVNNTQDRGANHFIQSLDRYLRPTLHEKTRAVLAGIASVVFEQPIDVEFVKRVLRHKMSP